MTSEHSSALSSETVSPCSALAGEVIAPADKSLSHRAAILGSIAEGKTRINNFLHAEDCLATLAAMRMMGVSAREKERVVEIQGAGLQGLREPTEMIDCGNSGTTMRLLMGLLAAQKFPSRLTGDQYLRRRPMDRVIKPLRQMGARLRGQEGDRLAPIEIEPAQNLKPIHYDSPVASAQVKSAILFAGLYCAGKTSVREPYKSRDHTERMLHRFGGRVAVSEFNASITGPASLRGQELTIPGDISSAAFFLAAAASLPGSELVLRNIGLNPTRAGIIDVLRKMGIEISGAQVKDNGLDEPSGEIRIIGPKKLTAFHITSPDIPRLIDEIPALVALAFRAKGRTIIEGAQELRVKETDRISALVKNFRLLGANIDERPDGLAIEGPQRLRGGAVDSFGDHRVAMAMATAALTAEGPVTITDTDCVSTSFPGFFQILRAVAQQK